MPTVQASACGLPTSEVDWTGQSTLAAGHCCCISGQSTRRGEARATSGPVTSGQGVALPSKDHQLARRSARISRRSARREEIRSVIIIIIASSRRDFIFGDAVIIGEPVWPSGKVLGLVMVTSVRNRFGSPFSSKVVACRHCLVALSLTN